MLSKFFLWCSGVDNELIEKIPLEKSKYISIGLSIFISTVFAFLSGSYAFSSIFDDYYISVVIGIIWAVMAFGLDRSLTMSFNFSYYTDKLSPLNLLKRAFPILIFNFLLAVIFTTPLVLQLFNKEVNEKQIELSSLKILDLKNEKSVPFDSTLKELFTQREDLNREIYKLELEFRNERLSEEFIKKGARQKADNLLHQIQQKKQILKKLENDIKQISVERENAISSIDSLSGIYYTGLIGKLESLESLEKESIAVSFIRFLILFFFFTIQMLPFVLKYFSKSNSYEKLFESQGDFQLKKALKQKTFKGNSVEKNAEYYDFEGYFLQIINNVNKVTSIYDKKAANLLLYGIGIIGVGILSYFTFIFYWLDLFKTNGFKIYYLYTIAGSSLSFLFIEMLGGWFLKQYKYCIDKNHFHLKLKTILERQFLSYLFLSEIGTNKEHHKAMVLEMLKTDINFPEFSENKSSAFMKEGFDALSNLTDIFKKMTEKK